MRGMFEAAGAVVSVESPVRRRRLTSARMKFVTRSPESNPRFVVEKWSPPARPIPMLSQNRISPDVDTSTNPGSRVGP